MDDGSGDATALLGMEGFVVLAMTEHDGEWWLLVETTMDPAGCPGCGVRAIGATVISADQAAFLTSSAPTARTGSDKACLVAPPRAPQRVPTPAAWVGEHARPRRAVVAIGHVRRSRPRPCRRLEGWRPSQSLVGPSRRPRLNLAKPGGLPLGAGGSASRRTPASCRSRAIRGRPGMAATSARRRAGVRSA